MGAPRITQQAAEARLQNIYQGKIVALRKFEGTTGTWPVRCLECQYEWKPPAARLFIGQGCFRCAEKGKFLSQEQAAERLKKSSNGKIVPIGKYERTTNRWAVQCIECNHQWMALPRSLFNGSGCGKCIPHGFQIDKPGILYYLRILNPNGPPIYKIGVTNRTVGERFERDRSKVTILETVQFENGKEALEMEKEILREYKSLRYYGPNVLLDGGNDELFKCDIFGIDNTPYTKTTWDHEENDFISTVDEAKFILAVQEALGVLNDGAYGLG